MYYAKLHLNNKVIAEAEKFSDCQKLAEETGVWDFAPGSVAPYYLTNISPDDCSNCKGLGVVSDGYENFKCGHCDGTKYSYEKSKGEYEP